uniref:SURF6 domain-containing protein n=1 Tax=Elaeophora elaphi TaxID=1147741 RepID=A0A0R3RPP1_9BILA
MLSKEDKQKLLDKCTEIDKIIKRNVDLIPIKNWQFDDETIEKLREQKHKIVDGHLTGEQKQRLSKVSKQRMAREIGVNCEKITDVLDWMAKNYGNTKPIKVRILSPLTVPNAVRELKKANNVKLENPIKSVAKVLNGREIDWLLALAVFSITNETAYADDNRKRMTGIRDNTTSETEDSSSYAATSTVTPIDALEGRKLALKRLQEKLEQFKAKRRGKMTAYEYEEKRKLKRRMSKLKMKQRRTDAKQQAKNSKLPSDEAIPNKRPKLENESKSERMEKNDDKLIFSKFDFIVREKQKFQKETKKDKRDKFTGKDYKRLLEKAEKREERLEQVRSKNPEKALRIEKSIQWKKALNRAEGQKVKDNPDLLKKSLKKKEKMKEWRKKKWANRVEHTLQMQARRQEKRTTMEPIFIHLLLILTVGKVVCYDTLVPDFSILQDDMLRLKRENSHRLKRSSFEYRGYSESHFYGIQSKINNQFAEFILQAATFAANVQRGRTFYYNIAKTCKLLRRHVIALHFIIYTMAVVVPSIFGLILAAFVWRSLVRQIDGIVMAPPDGVELPPLVNKPPGFYVPLHRRPIIYLQLAKEKFFGTKGLYVSVFTLTILLLLFKYFDLNILNRWDVVIISKK